MQSATSVMKFSELITLLEENDFSLVLQKEAIRYYAKGCIENSFALPTMKPMRLLLEVVMLS